MAWHHALDGHGAVWLVWARLLDRAAWFAGRAAAARCERAGTGEWGKIFPDQAMTLAAIDRLVHHATILEMNVDSYRRKEAVDKARGAGRPPTRATIKGSS